MNPLPNWRNRVLSISECWKGSKFQVTIPGPFKKKKNCFSDLGLLSAAWERPHMGQALPSSTSPPSLCKVKGNHSDLQAPRHLRILFLCLQWFNSSWWQMPSSGKIKSKKRLWNCFSKNQKEKIMTAKQTWSNQPLYLAFNLQTALNYSRAWAKVSLENI